MSLWLNDTLKDVDVVISGYGTLEVAFKPNDGGVGTHMRVVSQPRYSGAGASDVALAPNPVEPLLREERAADGPAPREPAATQAPTQGGLSGTSPPAGTNAPEPAATRARTTVDHPDHVARAIVEQPAAPEVEMASSRGASSSEMACSREATPSDDGTRARTPSDWGEYAADGMLLLSPSEAQLVPIDGAPGYFKMTNPRVLDILDGRSGSTSEATSSLADDKPSPRQRPNRSASARKRARLQAKRS
ncbi:hypothetical protein FA95DRAFT_1613728 [Auriscalpium vulgare]|uniref:Uncharacterized protein n=1 Tax=Auriscalpium vulgare TaxID=40419 RepID=A0ACB8R1N0_9AGAM|nr:hypothetical protein FA95DRAFT_1613728 [Auriscalpium vulgare]